MPRRRRAPPSRVTSAGHVNPSVHYLQYIIIMTIGKNSNHFEYYMISVFLLCLEDPNSSL